MAADCSPECCASPPSHQQGTRAPISPQPRQRLAPPSCLICATLVGENDSIVLICISPITVFVYLLALWVSSSVKCRFRPCSMHNYSHDALLEVATEGVGLMVLDLPVLHGAAPQVVIQLCSVDGCTALLVMGGVLPDPEVDVLGQETACFPGLGCSQRDQVRGQRASLCCWPLWPGENVA